MDSATQDLLDSIGDAKGWREESKRAALCRFVDQLSSGESDLETFLDEFVPNAD